jgi:tetratricopeptide (TPR) repeat protein
MRLSLLLLVSTLAHAQPPDPAYLPLSKAYEHLQSKQYDEAIEFFLKGIEAAPARPSIHKDLAYTYLKVGETEAARDQFAAAMALDPADFHVALEYAFLCHDTKLHAEARRVFDRIRKTGDPASRTTAEVAFQNIDQPLAAGIDRWKKALELAPESFTAHDELARLAEERDELPLAADHYICAPGSFFPAGSRRCSTWAGFSRR